MKYIKKFSSLGLVLLSSLGICSADYYGGADNYWDGLLNLFNAIGEVFSKIGSFFWSLIKFIYFAGRTIISIFVKIVGFLVNSYNGFYDYLIDVLQQLGLYMGSVTEIFVGLFLFVITLIVFQFIFRVFTGKYAILNIKKH